MVIDCIPDLAVRVHETPVVRRVIGMNDTSSEIIQIMLYL